MKTKVFPFVDRISQRSLAFGIPGRLAFKGNEASRRPYVFTLVSDFVQGGRNNYTIRIPKVSKSFSHGQLSVTRAPLDFVYRFANLIQQPITLGLNGEVVLKLVLKTDKITSPLKYAPVKTIIPLGFLVGRLSEASIFKNL